MEKLEKGNKQVVYEVTPEQVKVLQDSIKILEDGLKSGKDIQRVISEDITNFMKAHLKESVLISSILGMVLGSLGGVIANHKVLQREIDEIKGKLNQPEKEGKLVLPNPESSVYRLYNVYASIHKRGRRW